MFDIFETNKSEIDKISTEINLDLLEIADCKGTNSKKSRLSCISEHTKRAYILHLDPFTRFGVSKLKHTGSGDGLDWETVFNLLEQSKGRELSKISDRLSPLQVKIVNGIFDGFKDWKPGVKGASFLEIFPDSYRTFKVQLSNTWNPEDFEEGSFGQTKFDGIRCVTLVDHSGEHFPLSRNGLPVTQIDGWVTNEMQKFPGWVFDSETYAAGKHFQKVSGISKRKTSDDKVVVKIFDLIPFDAFMERKYDVPYIQRYEMLRELLKDSPLLELVADHEELNSIEEAIEFYHKQRANGEEGAIVKKRNGLYSFDRDDSWMKCKPLESIECRIIGKVEGSPKTKHVGRVGALIVRDPTGAVSRVGSGMSDVLRQEIWDNWEEVYENSICEVWYMERTEDGKFRHSRLKTIRLDKDDLNPTGH